MWYSRSISGSCAHQRFPTELTGSAGRVRKRLLTPVCAHVLASLGTDYRKAGFLPYLALVLGACVVLWANWFFVLPA